MFFKVVYYEPVTGPCSPQIVHRQSAINDKLAPKPTPNLSPMLTLTLNQAYSSNKRGKPGY